MDAVATVANERLIYCGFESTFDGNAVGFRMSALYFYTLYNGLISRASVSAVTVKGLEVP